MIHRGTYDGTIYHNPVNRFCIISVKTADKEVPQEARSTRRYKDHLIRFVATGYELPRTDAVELELDGEWTKGKYGVQLQVEQWREIVPKTRDGVEGYRGEIVGLAPFALQCPADFLQESMNVNHHLYLQMKTAVPTGTAALQSFDCTKYSRFGFTAKGQDCANVWAILCQFFLAMAIIQIQNEILDLCNRSLIVKGRNHSKMPLLSNRRTERSSALRKAASLSA